MDSPDFNSESPESPSSPQRHPTLWFEDGNLILIAGNTMFCVHRSILSRNSTVFEDMFSLPQPDQTEPTDDLPVICISDHPSEVAEVLELLYNGMKYPKRDTFPTWATVRAMARLGSKYIIEDLREEAINQIQRVFPQDIESLDRVSSGESCMVVTDDDAISLANIVRTLEEPHLHARALFKCCQLPGELLVQGQPGLDGTLEQLHPEDLGWCVRVLPIWTKSEIALDFTLMTFDTPPCNSSLSYTCSWRDAGTKVRCQHKALQLATCDPLRPFQGFLNGLYPEFTFCDDCQDYLKEQDAILRKGTLDSLELSFLA